MTGLTTGFTGGNTYTGGNIQTGSGNTHKGKDTMQAEAWKPETIQIVMFNNDNKIDDFTNAVGSFSSKSINTYDESNQSVA